MEKLPCFAHLTQVEEDHELPALKGKLRCSCGCETFRLHHNGKQAHPLLGSWYCSWILAKAAPLLIVARCSACGTGIPLHFDGQDKDGWHHPEKFALREFVHPRLHDQRVHIEVAYSWEHTEPEDGVTGYSDFCLDAWNDEYPKKIRIYE